MKLDLWRTRFLICPEIISYDVCWNAICFCFSEHYDCMKLLKLFTVLHKPCPSGDDCILLIFWDFSWKKSINIFLFSICWLEGNTFSEQNMLTLQNCKINLFVLVSLKVFCVHYPESYKYSSTVMTTFCKLLLDK